MNVGADAAAGDILLFLHADTHLPPDAADLIRRALEDPAVLGGNFTLRFDAPGLLPRLFAAVYNARSRRSRLFYGDSALFVRRSVFRCLGRLPRGRADGRLAFCLALRAEAKRRKPRSAALPNPAAALLHLSSRAPAASTASAASPGVWSAYGRFLHLLYTLGMKTEALER